MSSPSTTISSHPPPKNSSPLAKTVQTLPQNSTTNPTPTSHTKPPASSAPSPSPYHRLKTLFTKTRARRSSLLKLWRNYSAEPMINEGTMKELLKVDGDPLRVVLPARDGDRDGKKVKVEVEGKVKEMGLERGLNL